MIDCGDIVRVRATGERLLVACCHEDSGYLHSAGFPELRLRLSEVELIESATDDRRMEQLTAMAGSTGKGHRVQCARAKLEAMQQTGEAW